MALLFLMLKRFSVKETEHLLKVCVILKFIPLVIIENLNVTPCYTTRENVTFYDHCKIHFYLTSTLNKYLINILQVLFAIRGSL